ncbi:MAG: hypothetical protein HY275_18595 [Gemmatimonadetes bacterium]|nr:hypothetical protein [Gemmatimonadota bacterium]
MRVRSTLRRSLAACFALALAGCHSMVPLDHVPVANDEARVRLTDIGAAMMAPVVGPGVTGLRGHIIEIDSSKVRMSVVAVTDRDGLENTWLGETVTVQRQHISGFDKRELSPVRTTVVAVGILAGMIAIGGAVSGGSDGILQAFGIPRGR